MKILLQIVLSLVLCQYSYARTSSSLRVRIDDGKILGRHMTTLSGRSIRAFMGIPYAAPPVGDLRFKPAQKVEMWRNVLIAHTEPPKCTQIDIFRRPEYVVEGQEDCLYLNVYTPEIRKEDKNKKFPVMVWFHGGGLTCGHGGYSLYGPEYLLEHDIILVTGNYRLGPLGFMSTEDEHCSGNMGFKDQQMILEWVQMNIEKFNGNGHSVTIFGESAGGASVNYHMFSSLSRGLFHRAISQSGTVMETWANPARKGLAKMRAIRLADMMNCPISGTSMKEMVECLRKVPAANITMALANFIEWDQDPVISFPPVVEESELEEEPFIYDLRYSKHSLDIPWMVGITSEEGLIKTAAFLTKKKMLDDLVRNWEVALPLCFYYDHLPREDIQEINAEIYKFYFKEQFLGMNEKNLTHLWTDGLFSGMFHNLERRFRDNYRDNTFVYLFTHKGASSYSEALQGGVEKYHGTCHADDLFYLFPFHKTIPAFYNAIPTDDDRKLMHIMTKLWVNFATTGSPTPEWNTQSEFPFWSPATKFPLDYMQIGNENGNSEKLLEMKRDLYAKRADFWRTLRKKYHLQAWQTEDAVTKDEL